MNSRLTVVTGPPGVDIGPAVAKLGAGLDDGFAIRVVRSDNHDTPHTSPDPLHRSRDPRVDERTAEHPDDLWVSPGAVRLSVLPSAWQDPQTNLGVVYNAQPDRGLVEDIETLNALGLDPSHRLTVQSNIGSVANVRPPVEVGDVGVHARDAVLRAGGRVLIETGDGQTFLQALATVGIPPWAEWIGHLDRWIVLDVWHEADRLGCLPERLTESLPGLVQQAVEQLDGSSGAYGNTGQPPTLRVALMNTQLLIPGIAAHDYNVAADTGDAPHLDDGLALADFLDTVAERAGVEVHLIGTGRVEGTGVWTWIESGEYGNEDIWGL